MIFKSTSTGIENDHRSKIITILGRLNVLQPDVVQDLQSEVENWPDDKALVSYLITHLLATEADVSQAYAQIYNLPYVNLPETVDINIMKYIPKAVCVTYKIIPYKLDSSTLFIAVADPLHIKENKPGVLSELKSKEDFNFSLAITSLLEFERWISQYTDDMSFNFEPSAQIMASVASSIVHGFISLVGKEIKPELLHHLPLETIKDHRVVVFDNADGVYLLAVEQPTDRAVSSLIDQLQKRNNIKIKLFQTDGKSIDDVIARYHSVLPSDVETIVLHEQKIDLDTLHRIPFDVASDYHIILFASNGKEFSVASDRVKDLLLAKIVKYIEDKNNISIKVFQTDSEDFEYALDLYQEKSAQSNPLVTTGQLSSNVAAAPWKTNGAGQKSLPANVMPEKGANSIIITPAPVQLHSENIIIQSPQGGVVATQPSVSPPAKQAAPPPGKNVPINSKPSAGAMADSLAKRPPSVNVQYVDKDEKKPSPRAWVTDVLGFLGLGKVLSQKVVAEKKVIDTSTLPKLKQSPLQKSTPTTLKPPKPVTEPNGAAGADGSVPVNYSGGGQPTSASQAPGVGQPASGTQTASQPQASAKPQAAPVPGDDDLGKMLDKDVESAEELTDITKMGSIPKTVAAIVSYAIFTHASDIHIESETDKVRVRFRIDGILKDMISLPYDQQAAIASRIKILSKLKIDENRVPQDGRFEVMFGTRGVDLRVSCMPMVHGEKIVMRILDKSKGIMSLEDLGVLGRAFTTMVEAIGKPFGIVLSTGPTGSGKSTTLYAVLNRISVPGVNVVTLEDPVEYEINGVNQSQIKPKIGYTFAEGLRSILRQDPNIIMVGEIRDNETAAMATHAALTGHLVLSTLHTNDAAGALPRLMNMGVEPFLLTSSINAIEAQRLVRKICPNCIEEVQLPNGVVKTIEAELDAIPQSNTQDLERYIKPLRFFKGRGCDKCQAGYKGRIGIYEVMPMSDKLEELALKRSSSSDIQNQAVAEGMITMKQDGLLKALAGMTTVDEVLKETSD